MHTGFPLLSRLWPILLLLLAGCVPPVVLNYQGFHNVEFAPRSRPAEIHTKPVEDLLKGGYLLLGYVDLRQNVRECFDDGSCRKISETVPSREDVQRIAAERGGDVVTLVEEKQVLEKIQTSVCTAHSTYSYVLQGRVYTNTICTSSITRHGHREARLTRALIWRHEPKRATAEANDRAIRQAMESLDRTYRPAEQAAMPLPAGTSASAEIDALSTSTPPRSAGEAALPKILLAMSLGQDEEVRRLASTDESRRWRDSQGRTVLMLAVSQRQPLATIDLLLAAGHDPRVQDSYGNISLSYALMRGDPVVAQRLVQAGSSLQHRNSKGSNLMIFAVISNDPAMLDWAVQRGVDHRAVSDTGITPLMIAAVSGRERSLGWLLNRGAVPDARDHRGRTAVVYAASEGQVASLRALLAHKASSRIADRDGNTPLMYAALYDKPAAIAALLEAGAGVDDLNVRGDSALVVALARRHVASARLLIERGARLAGKNTGASDILAMAIRTGDAGLTEAVIRRGGNVRELERRNGRSLTWLTPPGASPELLRVLIRHGMDINYRGSDGRTPLMYAAQAGRVEIVRVLLELKADPNRRDARGRTALMLATIAGHAPVVGALREAGAKE
jgi:ankyrin repeat protein